MRKLFNACIVVTLVWGGIFAYQHHQKGDLEDKWPWFYVAPREARDFAYYRYGYEPPAEPQKETRNYTEEDKRMPNPHFATTMTYHDGMGGHYNKFKEKLRQSHTSKNSMSTAGKSYFKRRGFRHR